MEANGLISSSFRQYCWIALQFHYPLLAADILLKISHRNYFNMHFFDHKYNEVLVICSLATKVPIIGRT